MADQLDNKKILTDLIQKQMVVLGPNIALDTARMVAGLKISDDGAVAEISGDFKMVFKALAHEFKTLSESSTRQTLDWLSDKYPQIKN